MILACPQCGSKFEVPDNAIPQDGRMVRCTSCSNIWHALPPEKDKSVKSIISSLSEDIKLHLDDLSSLTQNEDTIAVEAKDSVEDMAAIPSQKPDHDNTFTSTPLDKADTLLFKVDLEANELEKEITSEPLSTETSKIDNQSPTEQTHPTQTKNKHNDRVKKPSLKVNAYGKTISKPSAFYESKFYRGWTFSFLCLAILILSFTLIYSFKAHLVAYQGMHHIFQRLGIFDNSTLKFENIITKTSLQKGNGLVSDNYKIVVKFEIRNHGSSKQIISKLRLSFFDHGMNYIDEYIIPVNRPINPGEMTVVEGILNSVPIETSYISADYGNKIELTLRNIHDLQNYK